MDSFKGLISSISPRWALIVIASALGIAAASVRALESEESKEQRAEQKKRKELRMLADRTSRYGRGVHQQFPTGDVVVSERDLAEQLRPDLFIMGYLAYRMIAS